jgi:hypothetical protein
VKRWPWAFIADELGDEAAREAHMRYSVQQEKRGRDDMLKREGQLKAAEQALTPKQPEPIPIERQMLCIKNCGMIGFTARLGLIGGSRLLGLTVPKDQPVNVRAWDIVDAAWVVVQRYSEHFVPVKPEGVAVEDARVCIAEEPIKRFSSTGLEVERIVYPKQMLHKDDELVALNPTMFAPIGTAVGSSRELIVVASPQQVVSDSARQSSGRGFA